jgi:hypothetical protein
MLINCLNIGRQLYASLSFYQHSMVNKTTCLNVYIKGSAWNKNISSMGRSDNIKFREKLISKIPGYFVGKRLQKHLSVCLCTTKTILKKKRAKPTEIRFEHKDHRGHHEVTYILKLFSSAYCRSRKLKSWDSNIIL